MTRNRIAHGMLAIAFAAVGTLQLLAPTDHVVLDSGSLPTINQFTDDGKTNDLSKEDRLNNNKGDQPILAKHGDLSADGF